MGRPECEPEQHATYVTPLSQFVTKHGNTIELNRRLIVLRYKAGAIIVAVVSLLGIAPVAQGADEMSTEDGWTRHHDSRAGDPMIWHKEACVDHYAKQVARLSYIEVKLNLTDQQHAAWDKYREARIETAGQIRTACLEYSPKAEESPTAIERNVRAEKLLSLRLHGLQASRPTLQALYDLLTPEQRAVLNQSSVRHHHWRGRA
jgi:Spy/CpxP family protein refolding chaperone